MFFLDDRRRRDDDEWVSNEKRKDDELIDEARQVVGWGDDLSQGSGVGGATAAEWWEAGDLCNFSGSAHDFSRREDAASVESAVQAFYEKTSRGRARFIVDFKAGRSVGVALKRSNTREDSLVGGVLLLNKNGGDDGDEETQPTPTPLVINVLASHGAVEVSVWKLTETEVNDDGCDDHETEGTDNGGDQESGGAGIGIKTTLTALNAKSKSFAFRLRPEAGKIALDQFHINALLRNQGYGLLCLGLIMAIASEFYPTVSWVVPQPTPNGRKFYRNVGFTTHLGDLVFIFKRRQEDDDDDNDDEEEEEEDEEEEEGRRTRVGWRRRSRRGQSRSRSL